MTKAFLRLAPWLFLTVLVWPAPVFAQPKPRAERPTYVLGEKWIRNDGLYELIRIEKDQYIFSARPHWEIHLSKDLGIQRVQRGDNRFEFAHPLDLKWPLEVGKSGSHNTTWQTPTTSGRWPLIAISWKVASYEDVQVFAGTFKAFRIEMVMVRPDGRQFTSNLWYAPEVRQYVKMDGDPGFFRFQIAGLDRPTAGPVQFALEGLPEKDRIGVDGFTIGGKVTAAKGLVKVFVTVNGAEVASVEESRAPKPEIPLNVPVKLREGKNVVIVTATDADGTSRQEARGITYLPPGGPAVAAGAPPRPQDAEPHLPGHPGPVPPSGARPSPPPVVAASSPPPPTASLQVTLSSPADKARVEQETVALAGLAASAKQVRRVLVSINGVEVLRQEPTAPSVAVNLPLKLREGQNTLVVTATDSDGMTQQEVRTVYYEKPTPLAVSFRYPEDLKTAKALGLTIPQSLLLRADEVIQ